MNNKSAPLTPKRKHSSKGRHLLADFFGVNRGRLRDQRQLMKVLCTALKKEGFRLIRKAVSHQFAGGGKGVTGFVLLAESHAAFHSYPEHGYIAVDLYSCGRHDPRPVVEAIRAYLRPKKASYISQSRG